MTGPDIAQAFLDSRVDASNAAKYTTTSAPPGLCRYCGMSWRPARDTRMDGHARCITTQAFQRIVYELWLHHAEWTRGRLGEVCGVSPRVILVWTMHIERIDQSEKLQRAHRGASSKSKHY